VLKAPTTRIRRGFAVLGGLVVALIVISTASLLLGSNHLSPAQVLDGLLNADDSESGAVVWGSRVPRTVIGLLVGACLGVAGTLMQGHTRNPLADPGLFGVSAGAGLFVVLGVSVFGIVDPGATVWFSLAGALMATVAVFAITIAGSGTASPVPLALAGSAVSALLVAFTSFIVLTDRASLEAYRLWVVGSLIGRQLDIVTAVIPFVVVGLALAAANARSLDNLALGADLARGLGENIIRSRIVGLLAITLLTAAATAAAGPIGFVGLTVPHIARAFVRGGHSWAIPASALIGAGVVLLADIIGRLVGGFAEVEVGIVLAIVGGPVFVAIARRRSLVSL